MGTRKVDAYEEMIKAWAKFEIAAENVAKLEDLAEKHVQERGGNADNLTYAIDRILDQHAYKHRVAVRNSARDKIHAYSSLLVGLAAARQLTTMVDVDDDGNVVAHVPAQR